MLVIMSAIGACTQGSLNFALADGWTFSPRISGQELATDNVLLTPTNRRSDFETTLSPGFSITEDSERFQGNLDYSPSLYYYALTPAQNAIGHNLYANGTVTLVPDLAFFDVRGFAALQPSAPGLTGTAIATGTPLPTTGTPITTTVPILGPTLTNLSTGVPASQLSQDLSFSASPYLARRFGDFGAGELRYTFSNTQINSPTSAVVAPLGFSTQSSSDRTNEATASFNTGERFGPYEGRLLLDAAQSTGTGVLNQASSRVATLDSAYAVTPRIAALWAIGYEKIQFSGVPPTRIDDLVWGIGTRLKPSPDATITLRYGHANGITSPYLQILYYVTARTSLSVSYSESLSTLSQYIASNLAVSDLDQDHQLIDTRTLLPLSIVNSALGIQNGLFRNKQFDGALRTQWDRDNLSLLISASKDAIVAQNTPGSGISQESLGANFNWSHDLTPNSATSVGIGYVRFRFAAPANVEEDLLTTSAQITYSLNASLTGSAGYSFLDRFSANPQLRLSANVVFVSLRKAF
jgi:uncharacterized protein (PEP-CTERM system associated)